MEKLIYFLLRLGVSYIIFFTTITIFGQEYATDRLFIKQYDKSKCLRAVEERVNSLKTKREMTLEHEFLLNKNIWNKIRTKLPLSPGEIKRLQKLKENGITSNKLTNKKFWAKKEKEFRALRSRCK